MCMSSYVLQILAEQPSLAVTEVSKLTGQRWKELSADQRAPYEALWKADKERYAPPHAVLVLLLLSFSVFLVCVFMFDVLRVKLYLAVDTLSTVFLAANVFAVVADTQGRWLSTSASRRSRAGTTPPLTRGRKTETEREKRTEAAMPGTTTKLKV
jgi:peptidoglycan/LPS O-acetylase OafA/YrhL